ncbi:unnamed protein product [Caenorhabditis auriculariae]|uniref:Mitochondrial inner membrane protein Mpv17 n=1 Tax=Caenorhabditis auriculariae TaxID=2777116 RepID=A0A8S1HU10_9PELO|nr:unnamed protein product [Caenorhabditis auriculariae]
MIRAFQRQLAIHPFRTQVVVSASIGAAGDVLAQYITQEPKWDKLRTARFFFLTAGFIVPAQFVWLRFLERVKFGGPKFNPLIRVFLDQVAFSPVIGSLTLINLWLLEGYSLKESKEKWDQIFGTIYKNSLFVWPSVQLINFYLVPLNYRIFLIQTVALLWNAYMSISTQKSQNPISKIPKPLMSSNH